LGLRAYFQRVPVDNEDWRQMLIQLNRIERLSAGASVYARLALVLVAGIAVGLTIKFWPW